LLYRSWEGDSGGAVAARKKPDALVVVCLKGGGGTTNKEERIDNLLKWGADGCEGVQELGREGAGSAAAKNTTTRGKRLKKKP